ncbi:MFS transporter [Loigolactobacillus iwatensis]|uniref:MFS transporter n=1 Tax=Loigolactobacillus iwatensis TaxID=1267156 RepID=UPI000F7E31BE|nr:MFS transporter [Loigolactobacillus iwatensis]
MKDNWQHRAYLFLFSQNISLFGSMVTGFAITWYISLKTNSGIWLSLATVCTLLPQIIVALIGGSLADRYSRKWLIIFSDGGIALATLILLILFSLGQQAMWLLLVFAAIRSIGQGLQQPAVSSAYPQLVPQNNLTQINGLNQTLMSLSNLLAPVIGGLILANFNLKFAFLIDIVTAIIEISCLLSLHFPQFIKVENEQPTIRQTLFGGLRYVRQTTVLKHLLFIYLSTFLFMVPVMVLSLLLIQRRYGASVTNLTWQEVVWASGSIVGGLAITKQKKFKNNQHALTISVALFGVIMATMGIMPNFSGYLFLVFGCGLVMPYMMTAQTVIIQNTTVEQWMGRIFAVFQVASNLMILVGTLLFGPLADYLPVQWLFILCGSLMLLCALIYYRQVTKVVKL